MTCENSHDGMRFMEQLSPSNRPESSKVTAPRKPSWKCRPGLCIPSHNGEKMVSGEKVLGSGAVMQFCTASADFPAHSLKAPCQHAPCSPEHVL